MLIERPFGLDFRTGVAGVITSMVLSVAVRVVGIPIGLCLFSVVFVVDVLVRVAANRAFDIDAVVALVLVHAVVNLL